MQSIKLKSHIGSDGVLHLHLPEMQDTDVEITITYNTPRSQEAQWSIDKFYGICADDPIGEGCDIALEKD